MRLLESSRSRSVVGCLTDCCLRNEPATIISPDSGIVCKGEFNCLDRDSVTLRLKSNDTPMLSESLCCVTFSDRQRPRVFFTAIIGVVDKPRLEIVLVLPSEIVAAERRHAMRVPVVPDAALEVNLLLSDGSSRCCTATNVSTIGVLVEFPHDVMPDLDVDSQLCLTMSSQSSFVELPVSVVRRNENGYAFSFVRNARSNNLGQREELAAVVKDVEYALLRMHLGREGNGETILNLKDVFATK